MECLFGKVLFQDMVGHFVVHKPNMSRPVLFSVSSDNPGETI